MHLCTPVGAGVGDDHQGVVDAGGPAHGREDHAARRDAEQEKRVDVPGAQDRLEIGRGEGPYATLDYGRVRTFARGSGFT